MKKDVLLFAVGVTLGYCIVKGLAYAHHHYLWTLFYQ